MTSDNGPIGTFNQKIAIGYAFGICDERTRDNLYNVRSIRNAFAHSKTIISFDHELVLDELKKIKTRDRRYSRFFKTPSADGTNVYSSSLYDSLASTRSETISGTQDQLDKAQESTNR